MKAVLFEDFRDKFELDTPLTSNADITKLRTELGIPQYVAAEDYLMRRLVVTVWAARNANLICEQLSGDAKKRVPKSPVDVAFFGVRHSGSCARAQTSQVRSTEPLTIWTSSPRRRGLPTSSTLCLCLDRCSEQNTFIS